MATATLGDVTLDVSGQTLTVNGVDNGVNDDDAFFSGVKNIVINTNGGSDHVQINDITIAGSLTANLGAGNYESLELEAYGYGTSSNTYFGGNVTLSGGTGYGDSLEVETDNRWGYGLTIGGNLNLTVGNDGDVEVTTEWYGGNITVGKNVTINVLSAAGGYGDGMIFTQGNAGDINVVGSVTMNGGAGSDELSIHTSQYGSGGDQAIGIAGSVTMNGNGGDDHLAITAYGHAVGYGFNSFGYGYSTDGSITTGAERGRERRS